MGGGAGTAVCLLFGAGLTKKNGPSQRPASSRPAVQREPKRMRSLRHRFSLILLQIQIPIQIPQVQIQSQSRPFPILPSPSLRQPPPRRTNKLRPVAQPPPPKGPTIPCPFLLTAASSPAIISLPALWDWPSKMTRLHTKFDLFRLPFAAWTTHMTCMFFFSSPLSVLTHDPFFKPRLAREKQRSTRPHRCQNHAALRNTL